MEYRMKVTTIEETRCILTEIWDTKSHSFLLVGRHENPKKLVLNLWWIRAQTVENSTVKLAKNSPTMELHACTASITSENGRPTINFTMTKNMVINSTFFPHKDIHKTVLVSHMYCL
jgi:hypothetical protein